MGTSHSSNGWSGYTQYYELRRGATANHALVWVDHTARPQKNGLLLDIINFEHHHQFYNVPPPFVVLTRRYFTDSVMFVCRLSEDVHGDLLRVYCLTHANVDPPVVNADLVRQLFVPLPPGGSPLFAAFDTRPEGFLSPDLGWLTGLLLPAPRVWPVADRGITSLIMRFLETADRTSTAVVRIPGMLRGYHVTDMTSVAAVRRAFDGIAAAGPGSTLQYLRLTWPESPLLLGRGVGRYVPPPSPAPVPFATLRALYAAVPEERRRPLRAVVHTGPDLLQDGIVSAASDYSVQGLIGAFGEGITVFRVQLPPEAWRFDASPRPFPPNQRVVAFEGSADGEEQPPQNGTTGLWTWILGGCPGVLWLDFLSTQRWPDIVDAVRDAPLIRAPRWVFVGAGAAEDGYAPPLLRGAVTRGVFANTRFYVKIEPNSDSERVEWWPWAALQPQDYQGSRNLHLHCIFRYDEEYHGHDDDLYDDMITYRGFWARFAEFAARLVQQGCVRRLVLELRVDDEDWADAARSVTDAFRWYFLDHVKGLFPDVPTLDFLWKTTAAPAPEVLAKAQEAMDETGRTANFYTNGPPPVSTATHPRLTFRRIQGARLGVHQFGLLELADEDNWSSDRFFFA